MDEPSENKIDPSRAYLVEIIVSVGGLLLIMFLTNDKDFFKELNLANLIVTVLVGEAIVRALKK